MIEAIDFEYEREDTRATRGEIFIKIWDFMRFDLASKTPSLWCMRLFSQCIEITVSASQDRENI